MLENLKKRFGNAIQEGIVISDSLQQQYRTRISTPSTPATPNSPLDFTFSFITKRDSSSNLSNLSNELHIPQNINMAAGCNLLSKYEDDWKSIHDMNELNANKGEEIAATINLVEQRTVNLSVGMRDLITCLSGIPQVLTKLKNTIETLEEVKNLTLNIEKEIIILEDLSNECQFQEYMLQKQCELSQYKQKKTSTLEIHRQEIAAQHKNKILKHEQRLRQIQKERQAVFDEAFRVDVQDFKERGVISKIHPFPDSKLSLEEVDLRDVDTNDALENFLNG